MRRNIILIVCLFISCFEVLSQEWDSFTEITEYTRFSRKEYSTVRKASIYDGASRKKVLGAADPGTCFLSDKFAYVQDTTESPFDTFEYMIGYKDGWISTDDLVLAGSDVFDDSVRTDNKSRFERKWIPVWYNSIIDSGNRIEEYYPSTRQYVLYPEEAGKFSTIYVHGISFRNNLIIFSKPRGNYYFSVVNIKKENNLYHVECELDKSEKDHFNKKFEEESFLNLPDLTNDQNATLIIEQNGNRVRLYNGKNNRLIIELMAVSQEWINDIVSYINSGYENKPATLNAIDERLEYQWPDLSDKTDLPDTKSGVSVNKTMAVKENLKLRSGEATTTSVLTVMKAGAKVKILRLGKPETIDGISGNWVQVEVLSGKDRDGKTLEKGTTGWCYGGYLE